MTPADREQLECVIAQECRAQDRRSDGATIAACRNTAQAAHELGRESALGEIETALRELARSGFESLSADLPTESASGYVVGLHRFTVADLPEISRTDNTFFEALLAAIDAVNEMRAGELMLRSKAGG